MPSFTSGLSWAYKQVISSAKLQQMVDNDEHLKDLAYVECTSSTRPAHRPGRRIHETDTGRHLISDGTTWVTILTGSTGWQGLGNPGDGWSASGNGYMVRGAVGILTLDMQRTGSAFGPTDLTMGTLPPEHRPTRSVFSSAVNQSSREPYTFVVGSSGAVVVASVVMASGDRLRGSIVWPAG